MFDNEILVVENFLPKDIHYNLLNIVNDENSFPWYFLSSASGISKKNKNLNQYAFSHILYSIENKNISSFFFKEFYVIQNFIDNAFCIKTKEIIRYRLGLNLKISNKNIEHFAHKDFDFDHLTFLYYLNDSDGPTRFYDDSLKEKVQINPQANKGVLFDGKILHSSSTPTKNTKRIALNINFFCIGAK